MRKNTSHIFIIILAGGGGTRLWPVSRKNTPKQILPFFGKKTLLQTTVARMQKIAPLKQMFIVTNVAHAALVKRQIPKIPDAHILREPTKRDTAGAIAYAAAVILAKDPSAIVYTVSSDGYMQDEKAFVDVSKKSIDVIRAHPMYSLLIGINPTYPETGYGYIQMGKRFKAADVDGDVFHVGRFVEKPNLDKARSYVKKWGFLWNGSLFIWHIQTLVGLFKQFLPKHAYAIQLIARAYGKKTFGSAVKKAFEHMPKISIDYGLIEKTEHLLVAPGNFGWSDIGHWRSVKDVLSKRSEENVVRGLHEGIDTTGSLVFGYANRLVATIGLKDFIVVDTPDVLLICPKSDSQRVKQLVEKLQKKNLSPYV